MNSEAVTGTGKAEWNIDNGPYFQGVYILVFKGRKGEDR